MQPISVLITTHNEADNIRGVLESVQWADEVMVVDSFSTDETVALASTYTDKVLQRAYKGPADQKNWAIPQLSHEWVLILDADERVRPELKAEIQYWLQQEDIPFDAFWINRQNHFMGQQVRYSGWQGDAVVRFFRRDKGRYDAKQVHEEIVTDGIRVSRLKTKMDHYTFKDINHFLDKMRRYAEWSARDHQARTPHVGWFHLWIKPAFRFFKHFVLQRGFLDGKVGFVVSVIMAWGVFLRYVKMMEKERGRIS
ncbi:MAG: glycosyl transferase [Saprospiraceae bacterium]|nr:MAG: glycosyl transferase [Saprospiraceae bacterium]